MSVTRTVASGLAAVVAAAVGLAGLWLLGMRDKDSAVVRLQRRVNRDHMNERVRATAGTVGSTTALVRHTGRRSGRSYETPVDAIPTPDGFVVAMVYGPDTDWVRNVVAGGPATVVRDGVEHTVLSAEVADVAQVADAFTASQRQVGRLFGIRQALVVRTAR